MTGSSAAADAFADALNGAANGLPEDAEMMLVIVDRLHRIPGSTALADADARPDFRSQLRSRLLEEAGQERPEGAKVVPLTSRWNQSWGRRNRVRLVSGIAAGIVGLVAVSVAASNSLPGSPFYQLKRGSESVQYAFAGSDEARGKLELGFARTRLSEIDRLTQHNAAYGIQPTDAPQAAGGTTVMATSVSTTVVRLFADMDSEAAKGQALLAKSFKGDPRPGPLLAVQQFAKDQAAALTTLRSRLAEPALSKATHSLAWAKQVVTSSTRALATCDDSTCPAAAVTGVGGSPIPSLAPSAPPSSGPSAVPPSLIPSQAAPSQPVVVPSPAASSPASQSGPAVTPQPTTGQPNTTPPTTDQPTTAPPTDVPPTDVPPTTEPPTSAPPTTEPPTTEPPTAPPTTDPPTTEPQPSVPVIVPTTPVPSAPVETTNPPPPSSAPPTTDPVVTPDPTTQPPPPTTTAAPTTTAPVVTPSPTRTGRPPLICLPPSYLRDGACVHLPRPPGVGTSAR